MPIRTKSIPALCYSRGYDVRIYAVVEAAELITRAYEKTVADKVVTYDFARQMDGAREVKTSEFASAVIDNMSRV
jgi:isocitrate dehydrogenase